MNHLLLSEISNGMIADIVLVAILAIFAVVNISKGFFKQVIKLACAIVALLCAYLFCDDLINLLNGKFNLTQLVGEKLLDVFSKSAAMLEELTEENLVAAISSLKLPEFINEFAINALSGVTEGLYDNIGHYLSTIVTNYALTGAAFLAIYIVARIILFIVAKLLEALVKLPIIRNIDKILGFILGLVKALLLIFIVLFVLDVLPLEQLQPIKTTISDSYLTSWLQKHNLFTEIINYVVQNVKI